MRSILAAIFVIFCTSAPAAAGDFLAYVQTFYAPILVTNGKVQSSWSMEQQKVVDFINMQRAIMGGGIRASSRFMVRADAISITHLPGGNNFLVAAERYRPRKNTQPTTIYEIHCSLNEAKFGVRIVRTIHVPWQFIDDTKSHVCRGIQAGPDGIVWETRRGPVQKHPSYIEVAAVNWQTQKVLGKCRFYVKDLGEGGMPEPLNHAAILFAYPHFKQVMRNGVVHNHFGELLTTLIMENGRKHILHLAPKLPDKPFLCATRGGRTTGITYDGRNFVSFSIGPQGKLSAPYTRKLPLKAIEAKHVFRLKSQRTWPVSAESYCWISRHEAAALVRYASHQKLICLNPSTGIITHVQEVKPSVQWLFARHGKLYLINDMGGIIPWAINGPSKETFGIAPNSVAGVTGSQ